MELVLVKPHEIDKAWEMGADSMELSTNHSYGETTISQLKMMLALGQRTLFAFRTENKIVGWIVLEVIQFPNVRALFVHDIQGEGLLNNECQELLMNYAQYSGCSLIRCAARRSMGRKLMSLHWQERSTIYELGV